jgi:hypothetical protein
MMHPIAIVEDRYGGVYSRGRWLAVAEFDARDVAGDGARTRLDYVMEHAHGDDVTARLFWDDDAPALPWLAVGDTPDQALANLEARSRSRDFNRSGWICRPSRRTVRSASPLPHAVYGGEAGIRRPPPSAPHPSEARQRPTSSSRSRRSLPGEGRGGGPLAIRPALP